jgi:hypothetical protein
MSEQDMLQRANIEIKDLRRKNELMGARLDVFDSMMRLFHTNPNFGTSGMMHPDIAWEIDKYLESKKTEDNGTN